MLYFVGDSNSVFTAKYFSGKKDEKSLCRAGLKTSEILEMVRKNKKYTDDATAFFVFCGMNDDILGKDTAENIEEIVKELRGKCKNVPIFMALPFCVNDDRNIQECEHKRKAALLLKRYSVENDILVIDLHVTEDMDVKEEFITNLSRSTKRDILHLKENAYEKIAHRLGEVRKDSNDAAGCNKATYEFESVESTDDESPDREEVFDITVLNSSGGEEDSSEDEEVFDTAFLTSSEEDASSQDEEEEVEEEEERQERQKRQLERESGFTVACENAKRLREPGDEHMAKEGKTSLKESPHHQEVRE